MPHDIKTPIGYDTQKNVNYAHARHSIGSDIIDSTIGVVVRAHERIVLKKALFTGFLILFGFSLPRVVSPAHAESRRFLMGTSSFADIFTFKFENMEDVDFVSIHMDDFLGIPWTEFQNNTVPPPAWAARIKTIQTDVAATGKTIFLSLGPLADRKTLARGVDPAGSPVNNWAPVDVNGCYAFGSDPNSENHRRAYTNYVKYMVDTFHPHYLGLVVEMNIQFSKCPTFKDGFIDWYSGVYREVKATYPSLPMFATFQMEHMYGMADDSSWCGGPRTDVSLADCFQQRLNEVVAIPGDLIAFSLYPANWKYPPLSPDTRSTTFPYDDTFSRVQQTTPRKILISETGWGAVPVLVSYQHTAPPSSCGSALIPAPIVFGESNMADHLTQLLAQARAGNFEGVVWWSNRDILDAETADNCPCVGANPTCDSNEVLYQAGGNTGEIIWRMFGNMGLRQNNGSPRLAVYNIWKIYQNESFSPADSLADIKSYPNPMRPAKGHLGVNFSNLPLEAVLTVYSLEGKEIYSLEASSAGRGFWPGTNQTGQKVASGVYYVLVKAVGASKIVKVVIQR